MRSFLHESVLNSISLLTVWLCNFLAKNIVKKVDCKMLVKFTPKVKFTTFLQATFAGKLQTQNVTPSKILA